jgi:hypothetical protein
MDNLEKLLDAYIIYFQIKNDPIAKVKRLFSKSVLKDLFEFFKMGNTTIYGEPNTKIEQSDINNFIDYVISYGKNTKYELETIAEEYGIDTLRTAIVDYGQFYEGLVTNVSKGVSDLTTSTFRCRTLEANAKVTRETDISGIINWRGKPEFLIELFNKVNDYAYHDCNYDSYRMLEKIKRTIFSKSTPRPFTDIKHLTQLAIYKFTNTRILGAKIRIMFLEIMKAMIDDVILQCSMLVEKPGVRKLERLHLMNNDPRLNDVKYNDKAKAMNIKDEFEMNYTKFINVEQSKDSENRYVLGIIEVPESTESFCVQSVTDEKNVVKDHLQLTTETFNSAICFAKHTTYIVRKKHTPHAKVNTETLWEDEIVTELSKTEPTQLCHMDVLCFGHSKLFVNGTEKENDAQYRFLESTPEKIRFLYTRTLCTVEDARMLEKLYKTMNSTTTNSKFDSLIGTSSRDFPTPVLPIQHFKNPYVEQTAGKPVKIVKNLKKDINKPKCGKETKPCPRGKVINPKTGKCVNADGKIGKELALKEKEMNTKAANKASLNKYSKKKNIKHVV